MKFALVRPAFAALGLSLVAASVLAADEVTGAGATFPAPLYAKWADAYNKVSGARINYQSVGSGAGLKQIRSRPSSAAWCRWSTSRASRPARSS